MPLKKFENWLKRTEPAADRFKAVEPGAKRSLWIAAGAAAIACIPALRNMLPEPWDVADHSLNMALCIPSTSIAGLEFGRIAARIRPEASSRKLEAAAIGLGIAAITAANIVFETKSGAKFFNENFADFGGFPDPADIWYGLAGAVGAAFSTIRCYDFPQLKLPAHGLRPPVEPYE